MRKNTPRAICLNILNRVEEADRHPDVLLSDSFKRYRHLTPLDRSFLTELTYGVLRWRGRLDWFISYFSKIPLEKIEPKILNILRLGCYQILYLSKTPNPAAVNESVELAKRHRGKGGAGFVNAILRSIIREKGEVPYPAIDQEPALHISIVQSHPLWLVQRWVEERGVEETIKICTFNNQIPVLTLRTNTLKGSRNDLIGRLSHQGLNPIPTVFSKEGILVRDPPPTSELPFFKKGLYMIQDEASQFITSILDPKPDERILDACAAPGGKTTHMAQRMQNKGEIDAIDLHKRKLDLMVEMCSQLGIKMVRVMKWDATKPLPVSEGRVFDRILADVPCSGFGTLRRNPDLKWRRREEDIGRLPKLQYALLENLSGYVKKGGILVYSTCTVFPEENEEVVERFLDEHPTFYLDRIDELLPVNGHSLMKDGYFKTFPPENEMDGFFAARLIRKM